MLKKIALLFLSILIIFTGCKKENVPSNETPPEPPKEELEGLPIEYTLAEETVVYDKQQSEALLEAGDDYFVLDGNAPVPSIGEIICCPPTENIPYGFLGRVVSVSKSTRAGGGNHVQCENVSLDEAFETLQLEAEINLSEYVEGITDDQGNAIDFKLANAAIIDSLSVDPDAIVDSLDIDTKAEGAYEKCLELQIGDEDEDIVYGKLYCKNIMKLKIDIHPFSDPDIYISYENSTGVEGKMVLAALGIDLSQSIARLDLKIGRILLGTPPVVVLTPNLFVDFKAVAKGKIGLNSAFEYKISHTKTDLTYVNEDWDYVSRDLVNREEDCFKLAEIEIKGEFGFKPELGLEFWLYNMKENKIGLSLEGSYLAGCEAGFSFSDPNVVMESPALTFTTGLAAKAYGEVGIFGKTLARLELSKNLVLEKLQKSILPQLKNLTASLQNNTIASYIDVNFRSILKVDQVGVALLEEKEPGTEGIGRVLQLQEIRGTNTPTSKQVFFDISNSNVDRQKYCVAPYILYRGTYYYGEAVRVSVGSSLREQLIQLYQSTDGDNWFNNDNWCSEKPIEEWYGVTKEEEGKYRIDLYENHLVGTVSLKHKDISELVVAGNSLSKIDLQGCDNLRWLACDDNKLEELNISECRSLRTLNCNNCALTSLDLSSFPSLVNLMCDENALTSLDLSANPELSILYCARTSLTSLDLSSNPKLRFVLCTFNPYLTSVNVSGCHMLEQFWCRASQITSLDFSNCSALWELICDGNQLSYLNVSGCSSLKEIACGSNLLTSLDVSSCSALTTLSCNNNSLTSLNASGCSSLEGIYANGNSLTSLNIYGCPSLQVLSVGNNRLTSLDVSACSLLTELSCYNNVLSSLSIRGNTSLQKLGISGNAITSLDLSGCSSLTNFSIHGNPLKHVNLSSCSSLTGFAMMDTNMPTLETLDVSGCSSLQELRCPNNVLTSLNVYGCTSLNILRCEGNKLSSLDVSSCSSLQSLYCSDNALTSLAVNNGIQTLYCTNNRLFKMIEGVYANIPDFSYDHRFTYTVVTDENGVDHLYYYDNQNGWWHPEEPEGEPWL